LDVGSAEAQLDALVERRAKVEADLLRMADEAEGGGDAA
jgi:archaellum component FlaC